MLSRVIFRRNITNPKLRAIFEKGPKFREPRIVSWPKNYDLIKKQFSSVKKNGPAVLKSHR